MLQGGQSQFGLVQDMAVLFVATAVLVWVATRSYPRLTE
jgi:hypothetical protein